MHKTPQRIQFLDFIRGFAVIVMVIGHSIDSVLSIEARGTEIFRLYNAVRGFTAPLFLFVAGCAFAVATEKRWESFTIFGAPLMKRVLKMFLLIVIGYALHFPFFSFNKLLYHTTPEEYALLFQVDVLQCLAVSILLMHALILLLPNVRVFAYALAGLTAVLVLATPIVWMIDFASVFSPAIAPYFNQSQPSLFPLFPYAAFLFSGTLVGHFYLVARREGRERQFIWRMIHAGIGAVFAGVVLDLFSVTLYPPHDFWKTSPNFFLIRIGIVILGTAGFYFVRQLPGVLERNLVGLGQASLLVYVVHLVCVYGSAANDGLAQLIGQTFSYPQAFVIALAVLLAMVGLVHAWNYVRTHYALPARSVQVGLTSTLLYFFLTKPY